MIIVLPTPSAQLKAFSEATPPTHTARDGTKRAEITALGKESVQASVEDAQLGFAVSLKVVWIVVLMSLDDTQDGFGHR